MIPRFRPDSDCVGSVVRAKFREDVLDVSLNRFLVIDNLSAISLLAFPAAIALKDFDFSESLKVSSAT